MLTWCELIRVQDEMERLKRNMDRRKARERAKGIGSPSEANSPAADANDAEDGGSTSTPAGGKKGRSKKNTEGTARKCANCGQVGHIKTNKKCATPPFVSSHSKPANVCIHKALSYAQRHHEARRRDGIRIRRAAARSRRCGERVQWGGQHVWIHGHASCALEEQRLWDFLQWLPGCSRGESRS